MAVTSRSSPCAAKADFLGQPPPGEADLKAAQAELVALRLRHDESKREWREQKAALRFLASQRASRVAALEAELAAARKCPAVAITITPVAASSGPAARPGAEHMLDLCERNERNEPGDAFSGEMVAQHVRSAVLVAHEITAMRCTAKQGSRRQADLGPWYLSALHPGRFAPWPLCTLAPLGREESKDQKPTSPDL